MPPPRGPQEGAFLLSGYAFLKMQLLILSTDFPEPWEIQCIELWAHGLDCRGKKSVGL